MSTLQSVFVLLAASVMLFWLMFAVSGPRKIDTPNVIAELRYGSALRILALVVALAPPANMIYVIAGFAWKSNAMLALAGISLLAVSKFAGLLLFEVAGAQLLLTETSIVRFSPWVGLITLSWDKIEQIRYSQLNRWFVLSDGSRTIRVSRDMENIRVFVETVRRKVPADRCGSTAAIFDAIK